MSCIASVQFCCPRHIVGMSVDPSTEMQGRTGDCHSRDVARLIVQHAAVRLNTLCATDSASPSWNEDQTTDEKDADQGRCSPESMAQQPTDCMGDSKDVDIVLKGRPTRCGDPI